jgi:RNA polymerase sigma-70 factor (ECF subfamily)
VASRPNLSTIRPLPAGDAELVARIRAGDESAFEILHNTYHHKLWRFAYDQVRSASGAEEVVQEVFIALWRTRAAWELSTSVAGWLYGAARHHALRHLQRERTVVRITERAAAQVTPVGTRAVAAAEMAAVPATAHDALEAGELDDSIVRAVSALPERRRIAMSLRWTHQLSAPEIAAVLGTAPEAVRVLLTRARRELVGLLEHGSDAPL